VKFLVITQEGEIIGSFAPEWQMFVGSTVTVPVKTTVLNGKQYKSVERPPTNQQQGAIARTTRMMPPPSASSKPSTATQGQLLASETQEMQVRIARIEVGLAQLLKRVDDVAAVQGDTAEGVRAITTLLRRHHHPVRDDTGVGEPSDESDESDLENPGPSELPDPDDEPAEVS
jgi:hypothetical protein